MVGLEGWDLGLMAEDLRSQSAGFGPKLLTGFSAKKVLKKYPDATQIAGT